MQLISLIGHTQEIFGIITGSDRPADSLIDTFFRSHKYLGSHDRRFIAETTYGLLRHLRKCEFVLTNAITELSLDLHERDKRYILVLIYLFLQGNIKEITEELAAGGIKSPVLKSEISCLIPKLTAQIEVPKDPFVTHIGIKHSFPDWMVRKFIDQYGADEVERICSSLNEQAPLTLRVNTLKTDIEECRIELNKQGIETTKTNLSPVGLNFIKRMNAFSLKSFQDGWFEVQDEGSQLLPLIVDPKPNSKLLDVCAGAGGKTLEFAALMKNRGEIFATDINTYRLDELRKRAKRAGAQNIRVQEITDIGDLTERFKEFFNIVFVDAPCSGTGTIRRNPGMKWTVTEQTIEEVSKKQASILDSSAPLVKPGGRLVYATCSLLKQENEDVVEGFMTRHPEFDLIKIDESNSIMKKTGQVNGTQFIAFFPHIHGTDGFFCAFMEKKEAR